MTSLARHAVGGTAPPREWQADFGVSDASASESRALFCCLIIKIRRWFFKMARGCLWFNSWCFSFIYNLRFSWVSFPQSPQLSAGSLHGSLLGKMSLLFVLQDWPWVCQDIAIQRPLHARKYRLGDVHFQSRARELMGLLSWTCYILLGCHVIRGKLNEKMSAWINKLIREWVALLESAKVIWKNQMFPFSSCFSRGPQLSTWEFLYVCCSTGFFCSFIHPARGFSACSLWPSACPSSFARQVEGEAEWVLETAK